jgi:L-threonylcarbamoyladenylate synthase
VRQTAGVPALSSSTRDVGSAVEALRRGGLVGLPTETVYGLAADAESAAAVARVYAAKGRPADHPLIVHVAGAGDLDGWVGAAPRYALRLAAALWPGPLTLVVPRGPRAGDHVTGGQDTVGIRAPDHPVAQAVLAGFGRGLAAPSANRFGRVSPTTAADVLEELSAVLVDGLDVVLDGGTSRVGLESTILDCTGGQPVVLRPGAVGPAEVEAAGGVPVAIRRAGSQRRTPRAPGMLPSHYAPAAGVVLAVAAEVDGLAGAPPPAGHPPVTGLLAADGVPTPPGVVRLAAPADDTGYAQVLYRALREADALGLRRVVAVPPGGSGPLATAVADRLRRAAAGSAAGAGASPAGGIVAGQA